MKMDWTHDQSVVVAQRAIARVALIGNFPPRKCGIATFTEGVYDALTAAFPDCAVDVVAMVDPGAAYAFPDAVGMTVAQDDPDAYRRAADWLRGRGPDVVCVQHEFGIYGGPAGAWLLDLLERIDAPVVTTLHTVLTDPSADQRRVMMALARRSARLVVMAERGLAILRDVYGVPIHKIMVVPHGVPDVPLSPPDAFKAEFGLAGREVLFTFGLLSPNKGIEHMIAAMPRIVAARPDAVYVVLGATHPHLIAREGEAYRERLAALAAARGVGDHVRLINRYADDAALLRYLAAADIYVTPYLNIAQITSGTLSYAVALGKPVVSTPYWHAEELLGDGCGVLVPVGDADALADAAITLLSDDARRAAIGRRAYAAGRTMLWSRFAHRYMRMFRMVAHKPDTLVKLRHAPAPDLPRPALDGMLRLTDDCGIAQHGVFALPDRNHGYCLDDNARALMAVADLSVLPAPDERLPRLARTYAAFIHHAWNEAAGTYRNFMGYDRRWLEAEGSEDSIGRGFWAVATAAGARLPADVTQWARWQTRRALPRAARLGAPRARAFALLGLSALIAGGGGDEAVVAAARAHADALAALLPAGGAEWRWFEDGLSYDNARLAEALIRAGLALSAPGYGDAGLAALDWLCRVQTGRDGVFRPAGSDGFGRRREMPLPFDQQPLEAAATVDACVAGFSASGAWQWVVEARRAYDWFLGANDHDLAVAIPSEGDCHDGLTPDGLNLNRGAESVLAFVRATCAMHGLRHVERPAPPAHANEERERLGVA
ncbi:glycosyltransferase family 4 protein [Sphingomonas flavalba]|uniref:glycosyltransferase family 4 protein n=1 Tax=Sphingomonas flavalba TaxID=2559804 RepID=UPI00109E0B32|nr:glycosyltransferase family 4 protein [Sphingomonas flavalba]